MRPVTALLLLAGLAAPRAVAAQADSVLANRWVGVHRGRPLQFEFYGDTMLVVDDAHVLNFRLTGDSLVAYGDTSIAGRYRLVLDRMLLETPDGVVTMAVQSALARPLTGRWRGWLGTDDEAEAEVVIFASGTAQWRRLPGGRWLTGEWDREMRTVTFTWVDESEWRGQYDPMGNAMLLDSTVVGSQTTILRRVFR
jgi:hypothetical protein